MPRMEIVKVKFKPSDKLYKCLMPRNFDDKTALLIQNGFLPHGAKLLSIAHQINCIEIEYKFFDFEKFQNDFYTRLGKAIEDLPNQIRLYRKRHLPNPVPST